MEKWWWELFEFVDWEVVMVLGDSVGILQWTA